MAQKILVVDDDRQIARLVTSYLQQAGYDVNTAYDGETALATAAASRAREYAQERAEMKRAIQQRSQGTNEPKD